MLGVIYMECAIFAIVWRTEPNRTVVRILLTNSRNNYQAVSPEIHAKYPITRQPATLLVKNPIQFSFLSVLPSSNVHLIFSLPWSQILTVRLITKNYIRKCKKSTLDNFPPKAIPALPWRHLYVPI